MVRFLSCIGELKRSNFIAFISTGATKVVLDRNSESGLRCLDINLILRALNEGPIELNLCDSPELGPLPNPLILAVSAASITSSACAQMQYPPECCRSPPPIQSEPFG
ncbi:hypothetical protein AAC387_Pa08g2311 [Persea americana]